MSENQDKGLHKSIINWFPGHMAKALRQMKEKMNLVDIILELVDSRAPLATTNPILQEYQKKKCYLKIFTKIDLADDQLTQEWKQEMEKKQIPALFVNLAKKESISMILTKIKEITAPLVQKDIQRGLKPKTIRAMIVGIPNVGKSTLINALSKRKSAGVANKPGFTKAQQWIHCKDLDLLDTPGVLWPKLKENQNGIKLALLGSIKEEILPTHDLVKIAIAFLAKNYKTMWENHYQIAYHSNVETYLETFATKRGHLFQKDQLDYNRSEKAILNDLKNGIIGKITLERCNDDGWF